LEHQNFFAALLIMLESLRNYFDDPTKLFSSLYLARFFNFSKIITYYYNNSTINFNSTQRQTEYFSNYLFINKY